MNALKIKDHILDGFPVDIDMKTRSMSFKLILNTQEKALYLTHENKTATLNLDVSYHNDQTTVNYARLLELIDSHMREHFTQSSYQVDLEMNTERMLQFIPENMKNLYLKFVRLIVNIRFLLSFEFPSIEKKVRGIIQTTTILVLIYRRVKKELIQVQESYGTKNNIEMNDEIVETIKKMIDSLDAIDRVLINQLDSSVRTYKLIMSQELS